MTICVKVIDLDMVVTMKSILESAPKEVYLKMMAFLLSIKELPGGEAIFKANNGQRSNKAIVMAAFGACKSSYQFAEYVSKTHVIKIKKGKLDPPVPMKTIFKEGMTKAVKDLTRLLLYVKQALSDKAGENVYNANKFEKGRSGNARESLDNEAGGIQEKAAKNKQQPENENPEGSLNVAEEKEKRGSKDLSGNSPNKRPANDATKARSESQDQAPTNSPAAGTNSDASESESESSQGSEPLPCQFTLSTGDYISYIPYFRFGRRDYPEATILGVRADEEFPLTLSTRELLLRTNIVYKEGEIVDGKLIRYLTSYGRPLEKYQLVTGGITRIQQLQSTAAELKEFIRDVTSVFVDPSVSESGEDAKIPGQPLVASPITTQNDNNKGDPPESKSEQG